MSRHNSQRGLLALVAVAIVVAGGAAVAAATRLRRNSAEMEPQEPLYLELPDRPAAAGRYHHDDVDRGIAEGMGIAAAMHLNPEF